MRSRARTWVVVPSDDGTFELQRNGRPLASGLSERAIQRRLQRDRNSSDRIMIEDPDGYRSTVGLSEFARDQRKS
jgi:hypothetical protein